MTTGSPAPGSPKVLTSRQAAGLLFIAAKEAAKRAREFGAQTRTLGEETETMTAVVLCVIVAEAGINEIAEFLGGPYSHPLTIPNGLPEGFEGLELRMKWSLLPLLVRQRTFARGSEPWQSFRALVELRNAIVHLRRRPLPKAVDALLRAKKLEPLAFETARWACETIADMFEKLTELIDPPKVWLDGSWCWTPTHSFPHGLSTPGDPEGPSTSPLTG